MVWESCETKKNSEIHSNFIIDGLKQTQNRERKSLTVCISYWDIPWHIFMTLNSGALRIRERLLINNMHCTTMWFKQFRGEEWQNKKFMNFLRRVVGDCKIQQKASQLAFLLLLFYFGPFSPAYQPARDTSLKFEKRKKGKILWSGKIERHET